MFMPRVSVSSTAHGSLVANLDTGFHTSVLICRITPRPAGIRPWLGNPGPEEWFGHLQLCNASDAIIAGGFANQAMICFPSTKAHDHEGARYSRVSLQQYFGYQRTLCIKSCLQIPAIWSLSLVSSWANILAMSGESPVVYYQCSYRVRFHSGHYNLY